MHLCFNEDNPVHMLAYDYLKTLGRKKTRFITGLIYDYLNEQEKIDSQTISDAYTKAAEKSLNIVANSVINTVINKEPVSIVPETVHIQTTETSNFNDNKNIIENKYKSSSSENIVENAAVNKAILDNLAMFDGL